MIATKSTEARHARRQCERSLSRCGRQKLQQYHRSPLPSVLQKAAVFHTDHSRRGAPPLGDTSKRARVCGQPVRGVVSGFMIETSARHPSDQSRAAADAPGRGWTIHVLGMSTSWERDARSAIRSALEGSRRIVGMKREGRLLLLCLYGMLHDGCKTVLIH